MSKELVKKQEQQEKSLSNESSFSMASFIEGGLDSTDVSIAKALITQPMSTAKRENKSLKDGDLFLSTSKEPILSIGEEVEFTPIYVEKLLQTFENKGGESYESMKRGAWLKTEAVTAHNKDLPEISKDYVRNRIMACYSFFYTSKVPTILPTRLDFKGSSKKAFQPIFEKVATYSEDPDSKIKDPQFPQLDLVFTLNMVEKTNKDNQLFYALNVKFKRTTTEDEWVKAFNLLNMVKNLQSSDKYNDSDL